MGTKAFYTDTRTNKRLSTPTFGTPEQAMAYARNLPRTKDHSLEERPGVDACATVTACDAGTAEKQRLATSAHFKGVRLANDLAIGNKPKAPAPSREQLAELDMETYGAAYLATGSSEAALEEHNYVRAGR